MTNTATTFGTLIINHDSTDVTVELTTTSYDQRVLTSSLRLTGSDGADYSAVLRDTSGTRASVSLVIYYLVDAPEGTREAPSAIQIANIAVLLGWDVALRPRS